MGIVLTGFLSAFLYFILSSRPQNDDLGFLAFIEHFDGIWGFYSNTRENFEANLGFLLFILPGTYLQHFVPYSILLLSVYVLFILSLIWFFNTLAVFNRLQISPKLNWIFSIFLLVALVFTVWNRNTFQNGIYWYTGALACIFNISLMLAAWTFLLKRNLLMVVLSMFIVANGRSNYIIVFGFLTLMAWLFFETNKKGTLMVYISGAISFLLGFGYYLAGPGVFKRLEVSRDGETPLIARTPIEFIRDMGENFTNYCTEPGYLMVFLILFVVVIIKYPDIINLVVPGKKQLLFAGLLLFSLVLHEAFLTYILKAKVEYGRIYPFPHLIFLWVLLAAIAIIYSKLKASPTWANVTQRFVFPALLLLSVSIGLVFPTLKSDLYQAKQLSQQYDNRIGLIKKLQVEKIDCLILNRFPKSGVIGFHDINAGGDCGLERRAIEKYTDVVDYDAWVFEQYYKTNFRIVTVDRTQELPMNHYGIKYNVVKAE